MSKSQWLENQTGNFSNEKKDTFEPGKRYVGVRLQQGVPLLDRDWNELEDIRRFGEMELKRYYIGSGTPDNGFGVSPTEPPSLDFKISAGRCMVDGFDVVNQPVNNSDHILYSQQEGAEDLANLASGTPHTVYIDAWISEVGSEGDEDLANAQDIDIETSVRHQLRWCVRVVAGETYNKEPYHYYYNIAKITISPERKITGVEDLRITGLTLANIVNAGPTQPGETPGSGENLDLTGTLSFGAANRQMVNLFAQTHGIGVQDSTQYFRTVKNFAWYKGGSHNNTELNPGSSGTAQMVIKDGNVGIGTITPGAKLDVNGDIKGNGNLTVQGTQLSINNNTIGVNADNSDMNIAGDGLLYLRHKAGVRITKESGGNGNLNVEGNSFIDGNVGIGTSTPQAKLDVAGAIVIDEAKIGNPTAWEGYAGFSHKNQGVLGGYALMQHKDGDTLLNAPTGSKIQLRINNEDKMVLDANGNVGIGTSNPQAKLEVDGNIQGKSLVNVPDTFTVEGDSNTYYAVAFSDEDLLKGPSIFEISRLYVHKIEPDFWGTMNLSIRWHPWASGNSGSAFLEYRNEYDTRTFVKKIEPDGDRSLIIWLRGDTPYNFRYLNNKVTIRILDAQDNYLSNGRNFEPLTGDDSVVKKGTTTNGDSYFIGNVGIGTAEPKAKLHNVGDYYGKGHIFLHANQGDGQDGTAYIQARDDSNTSSIELRLRTQSQGQVLDAITITPDCNVGIGTSTPQAKLDVNGSIQGVSFSNKTTSFRIEGSENSYYAVVFQDYGYEDGPSTIEISRTQQHADGQDWWGTMILNVRWHADRIGHGSKLIEYTYNSQIRQCPTPFVKRIESHDHIDVPYLFVWLRGNTTYHYRYLNNRVELKEIIYDENPKDDYGGNNYPPEEYTQENPVSIPDGAWTSGNLYVDGNVGIGTSNPQAKLDVAGAIVIDEAKIGNPTAWEGYAGFFHKNQGFLGGYALMQHKDGDTLLNAPPGSKIYLRINNEDKMTLATDGNVGIGTSTPQEKLQVVGNIAADQLIPTGADYAEYFESKTGKEINPGTAVVLEDGKIRPAKKGESPFGIISARPGVVGGLHYDWPHKYLKDDFGVPIMEEYQEEIMAPDPKNPSKMIGTGQFETRTRPKLNPTYDTQKEYVSRDKRPEWNCVGLLGQLPLRKGQPVAESWIKIKDISDKAELWLVK